MKKATNLQWEKALRRTRRSSMQILSSIRYRDAIIFQAPSLVGAAYSFSGLAPDTVGTIGIFLLGGFLLMAHIFCFNDWSDNAFKQDQSISGAGNPEGGELRNREMLSLAVVLGLISLLLFLLISSALTLIALAAIALGIVYSFPNPQLKGKGIPVFSSALHFSGTLLTFLLGYALFSEVDARAVLIGSYFGMIISAGHLVQEVKDYVSDRSARISTNAVRFGPQNTFAIALALFTFSFVYLLILSLNGIVAPELRYLLVLLPVLGIMAQRTYKSDLSLDKVQQFRNRYRVLFAVLVLVMSASALISR